MELQLNLKLVQGPIQSLEKAKSKIPVNQNIGGIAAGTAFAGVLAESSSLLTSAPILVMAAKAQDGITFTGEIAGFAAKKKRVTAAQMRSKEVQHLNGI